MHLVGTVMCEKANMTHVYMWITLWKLWIYFKEIPKNRHKVRFGYKNCV